MSQTITPASAGAESESDSKLTLRIPDAVRLRLNGKAESVIAWSRFDVCDNGALGDRYLVLTDDKLLILDSDAQQTIPLDSIKEAKVMEGLGVDRLVVVNSDRLLAELPYSRHCRREMTRLHRKLERRLPGEDGKPKEKAPDWLEAVERQAEQKDYCTKCGELIPSYAEGVCPQCLHKRSILWRLLDVAKPHRARINLALALTVLMVPVAAAAPWISKSLIDSAIGGKGTVEYRIQQLLFWSAMSLLLVIVSEAIGGWRMRILANMGTVVARDLRHMVYAHLHELSLRYFSKRRTGSLITRVTNDTDRLWDFIVFGSVNLIRDVLMIVGCAAVMFWMNWQLALLSLLPLPFLGVLTYWRGMHMQRLFGRLWTYWSRMTAVVGDAVPGVRVVKAFANEQKEVSRFDTRSDEYTLKEQEVNIIWTQLQPVVSGTMRVGSLLVWVVGGYIVIKHPSDRNTLGTLVAFTQFLWQFYMPIMELANSNRMVTRAASSAQRVFEVLDTPPEIYSNATAVTPENLAGRIEFRSVAFSYEGAQPALRDVSLMIEPGEMIGLCGPSGAGKTTLVNLVCRFYDPVEGQILLDGVDLRDYDVKWLRRQVGVVLQEPYLFHGTIADNIRYGNPNASLDEVIRAAKAANAHDFVVGFPDGYDTIVGERGQSLSGGERQRVSIARAILHDPKILILDEATSSVDTETEKQIQEALDRLVEGRTTIAIAHRLSTLQAADRLIVLDKGKVAETGTHDELVNKEEGVYAKLHKTQVEMSTLMAIR
jgi:ATP-binding cassette, subfamily B, bacterial